MQVVATAPAAAMAHHPSAPDLAAAAAWKGRRLAVAKGGEGEEERWWQAEPGDDDDEGERSGTGEGGGEERIRPQRVAVGEKPCWHHAEVPRPPLEELKLKIYEQIYDGIYRICAVM